MKILFITSPAKPRKCGITDYVDLLSEELKKKEHEVLTHTIDSPKDFGTFTADLSTVDLCSIQFSPYGFSSAGISDPHLNRFANALSGKKTHLVFHEIWIGAYPGAKIKEKVIGWIQKREILKFIKLLNPSLVFGTNSATIDRLKREGIHAEYLYLFGNIPYFPKPSCSRKGHFRVAFFGTAYENFPYDKLDGFFSALSKTCAKELEIVIIGRQREDEGTARVLSLCKKNDFLIERTGELSTNLISEQLQECSLGVSTTPYDVIGKSGATAAMLEHGLPVLAYDDGDTPQESLFIPDSFKEQIFLINDHSSVEKLLQYIEKPRKSFFDGVGHTANKMLDLVS